MNKGFFIGWAMTWLAFPLYAETYRFSFNGEPVFPKIYPVDGSRMGLPEKGDLAIAFDFAFVLGEPGHYQLGFRSPLGTRLHCQIDEGPEHILAVRTVLDESTGKAELHNPLLQMSVEEKKGLRGIRLDVDPKDWEASLEAIDWKPNW